MALHEPFLRPLHWPACSAKGCPRRATVELMRQLTPIPLTLGSYCRQHGQRMLEQLQRQGLHGDGWQVFPASPPERQP